MHEGQVIVALEQGLHARPASEFVQKARKFASKVSIVTEGKAADARSILGIMGLAISKGTRVTIRAEGPDEVTAVGALSEFLSQTD